VNNKRALKTIRKLEVKNIPLGPPKKIIEPKTEIPNKCTYSAR
jgi:hypothetical protein